MYLVCRLLLEKKKKSLVNTLTWHVKQATTCTALTTLSSSRSPHPAPSSLLFFHAPPTTEIYTLSLHDALPIYRHRRQPSCTRSARSRIPRLRRRRPGTPLGYS